MTKNRASRKHRRHSDYNIGFDHLHATGNKNRPFASTEELLVAITYKDALAGDPKAAAEIIDILKKRERERERLLGPPAIEWSEPAKGPVFVGADAALQLLGLASKFHDGGTLRIGLKISAVERALEWLGLPPAPSGFWTRHVVPCEAEVEPYSLADDLEFGPPRPKRSPKDTQFKKGECPNPYGRPRKQVKVELPYDAFFAKTQTFVVHGKQIKMNRMEYLLHRLGLRAMKGDVHLRNLLKRTFVDARFTKFRVVEVVEGAQIIRIDTISDIGRHFGDDTDRELWDDPFSQCLRKLGLVNGRAKKKVLLFPKVVEYALSRFGDCRLTEDEQRVVVRCTSTPEKVRWPDWWKVFSVKND